MFNLQIFSDLHKNLENIVRCLKCVHFNKEKAKISMFSFSRSLNFFKDYLEYFTKFQSGKFQSWNSVACLVFCLNNSIFIFDTKQKYLNKIKN